MEWRRRYPYVGLVSSGSTTAMSFAPALEDGGGREIPYLSSADGVVACLPMFVQKIIPCHMFSIRPLCMWVYIFSSTQSIVYLHQFLIHSGEYVIAMVNILYKNMAMH